MAEFVLEQTASDVQRAINNALNPDTTLSESGKPADGKAVGIAIESLRAEQTNAVLFTKQSLSSEQKAQARENIGAAKDSSSSLDEDKLRSFAALFNDSGEAESFVFFADPHLLEVNTLTAMQSNMQTYLGCMKDYYEATPTSFVLCAGDWIGNSDTKEQACFKLGLLDSFMRKNFQPYYPVLGNHDTNYQGVDDSGTVGTGTLTNETIRNLMFRENENTYYSFKGQNTMFYVFESGSDWKPAMNDFRWEQVDWFANKLLEDDALHSAIAIHIYSGTSYVAADFAGNVLAVAQAYNNRTTLTLNEVDYDFTAATGRVEFLLAGHTHEDNVLMVNGIQVVVTTNMRDGSTPTFDLCLADYTNRKLYLERVGTGNSRRIVYLDEDKVDIETDEDAGSGDAGGDVETEGNYSNLLLLLGMARTGNKLYPVANRCAYVATTTTTGLAPFSQFEGQGYDYSNWDDYYPIEIPSGATQVKVTCPSTVKWLVLAGTSATNFTLDSDWQEPGGGTYNLGDGNTVCIIAFHDNNGTDMTVDGYDTSEYSLTFLTGSEDEGSGDTESEESEIYLARGFARTGSSLYPVSNRAAYVALNDVSGSNAFRQRDGYTYDGLDWNNYYLIAIPSGVTEVTVTCPSTVKWGVLSGTAAHFNSSSAFENDSGWLTVGGGTYTFPDGAEAFIVAFHDNNGTDMTVDGYDTSEYSIVFGSV